MTCPFCGEDEDDCTSWDDTVLGWVCETTGKVHPDDELPDTDVLRPGEIRLSDLPPF